MKTKTEAVAKAGVKLAHLIVGQFGDVIERDEEINGGDAVDYLVAILYPQALAIVQQDVHENRKGAR